MKYEGATQLGKIDLRNFSADIFFIFTDGNNTYGRPNPVTGTAHVYCVYSSSSANEAVLRKITGTNGGKVINLATTSLSQAIAINNKGENWLMGVSSSSGKTVIDQSLPVPLSKHIFLNGIMLSGNDTLIMKYGSNNKVTGIQKIPISANIDCPGRNIELIPALKRFEELLGSYDWETILEFGIKEKMVTANTAFIVLEKIEDYIKYNIAPPKELEKECQDRGYVKKDTRPERQKLKLADEFDVLDRTANAYNNKIKRWDGGSPGIVLTRAEFEHSSAANTEVNDVIAQKQSTAIVPPANLFGNTAASMSEVVVVGYSSLQKRSLTGAVTTVRGNELAFSTNIEGMLAGKVPGLSVISGDRSMTDSMNNFRIRGYGRISGGQPLFVLDGTPLTGNVNDFINPNDIESISVLRDSEAASLFGSRASNGAVVITSKKQNRNWYKYNNNKPYRLKDMSDMEYVEEIKETDRTEKYQAYLHLRQTYGKQAGFYFDMAQHFFDAGLKNEAFEILMNAAEVSKGQFQALRAVGFILESWKWFDKAIELYESMAETDPGSLDIRRDLAMAHYQHGNYQQAVTTFYDAIKDNIFDHERWKVSMKANMLIEMNAIIAIHRDSLSIDFIPSSLVRPLPVDLRIVVESNKGGASNVSFKEPGGEVCSYNKPVTKNGYLDNDLYTYYGATAYHAKNAKEGKYKITINYYGYNWQYGVPDFIRIIAFKNFGKPGQEIKIENVIMDNQYGEVEIGEVKW